MKNICKALLAVLVLAGCGIPIATPSGPEYRYSWVMRHDYTREGVQIGPKFDAAGSHVSVYWWINCNGAYLNCADYGYQLLEKLQPGSIHQYSLPECGINTYCPTIDGRAVARIVLPDPPPILEQGTELTAE